MGPDLIALLCGISGGTNIVSTTPENDPENANTANKGILERNTDSNRPE